MSSSKSIRHTLDQIGTERAVFSPLLLFDLCNNDHQKYTIAIKLSTQIITKLETDIEIVGDSGSGDIRGERSAGSQRSVVRELKSRAQDGK